MKNKFSEFYNSTDLNELWDECVFVFDTNVFIDLYYHKKLFNPFIDVLENKISDRIWMPYQVGLEYHRNRVKPLKEIEKKYFNLLSPLTSSKGIKKSVKTLIKEFSKNDHFTEIEKYVKLEDIEEDIDKLNELSSEIISKIDQNPDFFVNDLIRDKLDALFKDKIGDNYCDLKLKEIYLEGEIRNKNKTPPGFEDKKKAINPYGDLILWHQILDYAKENNKSIILVTGDSKKDWWFTTESNEIIGPHPSLIKEFREFLSTNNDFYMYKLSDFLRESKEYLEADIEEEAIDIAEEIEEIRNIEEQLEELDNNKNQTVSTRLFKSSITDALLNLNAGFPSVTSNLLNLNAGSPSITDAL
ncbi:MAG: PIN domain-containing protein, partial [Methanobacterium sp.]